MVRKSLNSKTDIACHLICMISKNTGSLNQHPCYQLGLGVNLDIEIKYLGEIFRDRHLGATNYENI